MNVQDKILITGASGQLGKELERLLGPERAVPKPRESLDITNIIALREWLPVLRPDMVINCAAITDPVLAEKNPRDCWRVNTQAVHSLITVCNELQIPLMHISSDYVFGQDAQRRVPYTEEDTPGPLGVYGNTKANAEHAILLATRGCTKDSSWFSCGGYWVIRTSAMYERPWRQYMNIPNNLLTLWSRRRGPVAVCSDVVTAPTYVPHLAKALLHIIDNRTDFPWGIYNITNRGQCSMYEFALAMGSVCKRRLEFQPTLKEQYCITHGSNARLLPSYSVLDGKKFAENAELVLPTWQEGVEEYFHLWNRNN